MKIDPYFPHCTKFDSRWIRASIRYPESDRREAGNGVECTSAGKDFLSGTLLTQRLRTTFKEQNLVKVKKKKKACTAKEENDTII